METTKVITPRFNCLAKRLFKSLEDHLNLAAPDMQKILHFLALV